MCVEVADRQAHDARAGLDQSPCHQKLERGPGPVGCVMLQIRCGNVLIQVSTGDFRIFTVQIKRFGESPVAFVVLEREHAFTAEEIADRANELLGTVQRVSAVVLCDDLPRNALGKIKKDELRERV